MKTMKAVVFKGKDQIAVEEVPKPTPRAGEAVTSLVTHRFALDDIQEALDLFSHQRDGVLKVALYPDAARATRPRETAAVGARDEQC